MLQHQLKLLGTVTGRDGLAPDPEKIKALQLFPPPRNKGQLREFFGTINWLRPFLGPRFASTGSGLRRYLKNKVADDFGELDAEALASFKALVQLGVDHILLSVPDYDAAARWEETGAPFEFFWMPACTELAQPCGRRSRVRGISASWQFSLAR